MDLFEINLIFRLFGPFRIVKTHTTDRKSVYSTKKTQQYDIATASFSCFNDITLSSGLVYPHGIQFVFTLVIITLMSHNIQISLSSDKIPFAFIIV